MFSLGCRAEREIIVQIQDARGDDKGGGGLLYPDHQVYVSGLFDLLSFEVSVDDKNVFFDFTFARLTNPFGAPEGYFHQRLEVLISTGSSITHSEIELGQHILHTPDPGWDMRLSVAPFQESVLYKGEELEAFRTDIISSVLPDGRTIRVKVPLSFLPHPNPAWGYYVLVGAFDGLARDFWRELGEGAWQVRGEGVPIFDLLAPSFSLKNQKVQLNKGILYPVYGQQISWSFLLSGGFVIAVIALFLWRWLRGRA